MSDLAAKQTIPIYAIPGLGVDRRIFKYLRLNQPIEILDWLEPKDQAESLPEYARRMAKSLPETGIMMMGLSFGGLLCQEIARFKPVQGVILLSSMRDQSGLSWYMDLMRSLPLYLLSRGDWRIKTMPLWGPLFGLKDKAEITYLQEIFAQFSPSYRMWAIKQLVHWQKAEELNDLCLFHIHGTKDEIFPPRLQKPDIWIKGGTHSMVFQRAAEVSKAIQTGIKYIESRT